MRKCGIIFFIAIMFGVMGQPPKRFYTKLGGSGIDIGYSVKQTLDNGYIICGSTTNYGSGNSDIVLQKLDSMGTVKWVSLLGGFNNDVGKAVIQLQDSGFIVAGFTNSYGSGGYDGILIRTDKLGNQVWLRTIGGADWDFVYDVIPTSDGNVVMCGSTTSFGRGKMDGIIAKYTTAGVQVWIKNYGGGEDDEFRGLYTANGTDILVAGTAKSFGEIKGDMMMYKVNASGDSLMRILYGGPEEEIGNDVVVDKSGNIHIAGGTKSWTVGKFDALAAKFTPTGTYLIKYNIGFAGHDEIIQKIINANSNFCDIALIYEDDEGVGTKKDFITIGVDQNYNFMPGGNNGSFGFIEGNEGPYDICTTKDKGFAQIGYTESLNAEDKDMLFVKRDSMFVYGTQVIGIGEENNVITEKIRVYPNPVAKDDKITVRMNGVANSDILIEIRDLSGQLQRELKITAMNKAATFSLTGLSPGIYFITMAGLNTLGCYKLVVL